LRYKTKFLTYFVDVLSNSYELQHPYVLFYFEQENNYIFRTEN
jgi:hypothetical protein